MPTRNFHLRENHPLACWLVEMIKLPTRTSLVHETSSVLKEWIASGMVKDVLPGEHELKGRLRVGRDTLRLALQALENEGWIEASSQGRKRRIHPRKLRATGKAGSNLPVTFLSPYQAKQAQDLDEMEETMKRLAEAGRTMQFIAPEVFHLKHPDRRLEQLVRAHPSVAWLLYATSQPVQAWFGQQGLPTLICGTPYPGVELPHIHQDWEPAGFHAGLQFLRYGHRQIGMFGYVKRGAGAILIEQGLRRALQQPGSQARLTVFGDERTPQSIVNCYEAAFKARERITAMVLTSSEHLLTCLSWLVSKGIRVPADVSVMVLPYEHWYSELHPPLSHYKPNIRGLSHGIADRVVELIEHGHVIRKSFKLPVEYVSGATIGPVPKTNQG
jgi:DNA-binding LacI/PurR family transcriptional regulator